MAEPMDILAWAEANLKRPGAGFEPGPLRLTALQRRMVEAMEEPGVRVILHKYRHRRSLEDYALMALAAERKR